MSSARETLEALDIQIADLQKRRDALALSADFIDGMEGKVDLPIPQLADLIASWESHKDEKAKAASEPVAVDVVTEEIAEPALDAVAEPSASKPA